jgi:hypothetical protein
MAQIATSIEITAPPTTVWEILTDFAAYPSWNPFVKSIVGSKEPGATLKVTLHPEGGRATTLKPRLLVCNAPEEFRWKGQLVVPGIFDGEHSFQLSALESGGTLFRHGETFSGFLVPLVFRGALKRATERGFEAMNQALKLRAESKSAA